MSAAVRVPRCRYHCGACQRHFASEAAFDAHRIGEHGLPNGDPEGRRCSAPHEDDRVGSEPGRCDVYGRQDGITIYFLTGDREGVRERLHGSGRSAEGHSWALTISAEADEIRYRAQAGEVEGSA